QKSPSFQVYNASAGSGKTFTLVKEYLKILLSSTNSYKFQQILAVTFTNKAAGEMKERVIKNLHSFSKKQRNDMLPVICKETGLTEEIVFNRSQLILNAILQNYAAFSITTIDSFTHKLIRTFAYDLQLPMNFEVEMDAESLLNEAVDVVISKIGDNKKLTDLLVNYALQKLDDDKAWDISKELKSFAKIILNENHATHLKELHAISINEFKLLKEQLQKDNKRIDDEFITIGNKGLNIINKSGVEEKDFYRSQFPKHFIALSDSSKKVSFFDQNTFKRNIEEEIFYSKSKSPSVKNAIDAIIPQLVKLYNQSELLFQQSTLNHLILNSLIPLAVLNYINSALETLKSENNILLNAEFNQRINDTIKNEPAPFIYERIGEKFRYYFIDEMQDTSELQWENLIPLIDHVISSENELGEQGKLVLVGDAKQSIYRWRGGKAEQFIELSSHEKKIENNPFHIDKTLLNLDTNYRSFSEIITFNNAFFKHISQFLKNESFRNLYFEGNNQRINKKKGGYVQLSFVENNKNVEERELVYPKKVLELIRNLDTSFQKNEVCVLVRTRKQGIAVANYLSDNGIEIISSETLLLENSPKVNFIVDLLNVLQNPLNKEYKIKLLYFLHQYLKIEEPKHSFSYRFIEFTNIQFFEELKKFNMFFNYNEFVQSPFYESIEYIVRSFNLVSESDSYIQFFLDIVFEFQQKKQGSLHEFLEYWDLKKDKLSIVAPEAKNAVRIMTIHKAKGLEFPVVIYPYNIEIYRQINPKVWYSYKKSSLIKSMLINYSSKLNYIGEQGKRLFEKQREEVELDNFNLLYVALTRPIEQLYIITEKNTSTKNEENLNYTSGLFINFLKQQNLWNSEQNDYSFGDKKRICTEPKEESKTTIQQSFITNSWKNHNISIVANSSLLWETDQGKAISYGNLIHEILSKIKTKNDILGIVNQYVYKGTISNNEQKKITAVLNEIVNHPQLLTYFEQNNQVFNEQEIMTSEKKIIIPDRLIVHGKNVTIIDYKTGVSDKKHHWQINNYAKALEYLDYSIEKKLLVYINNEIVVEEV
ncbi:MAG: UvrD-helicase domain-containing protein, partial [Lutibacter sp.]|nr:UvrD-helicase domain-containing protein [Lutibacter sp.]